MEREIENRASFVPEPAIKTFEAGGYLIPDDKTNTAGNNKEPQDAEDIEIALEGDKIMLKK